MADTQIGKLLGGRYRVDSLIEETAVADLYRGTNTIVDREVTIKIVSPRPADFKQEIFDEARSVSRISHPNILSVIDLGKDVDGTLYVIYEGFAGESLRSAFAHDGQFAVERAIGIVRQTASALVAAYPQRPTFGGLKTENILLAAGDDVDGQVKILNFFSVDTFNRPNRDAVFVPTVEDMNFAAPELIAGNEADERSDVYMLGSLLFRLLAGDIPFPGGSIPEATNKIANDPPPPMASFRTDLPEDLERVVLTAMAKNPEMRYQTVAEFSNELERFVSTSSEAAAATADAPRHDIWKTAFVVLAGISLLTIALIYATSVKQTNPTTQLLPDANGQPVQPINPATGIQEQNLANMQGMSAETFANSNMTVPPGTLPGGDGYDPWKNGVQPPAGAPKIGPGGQVVTIDPNNPSPFMTNDGPCIPQPSGILLCPAPANKAVKPTPTPKPNAANANVQIVPTPSPKPAVKPSPTVEKTPAKPAPTQKPLLSGKPKNGDEL
jgi:serine/threonine protein kinase